MDGAQRGASLGPFVDLGTRERTLCFPCYTLATPTGRLSVMDAPTILIGHLFLYMLGAEEIMEDDHTCVGE